MLLSKTKIEWVINPDGEQGYTANPIRGKCKYNCPYCYAETMRLRFQQSEEISWHPEVLQAIEKKKKPSTIFIGSMHDIFGDWVKNIWLKQIRDLIISSQQQHTFLYLTKNPYRLRHDQDITFNFQNNWLGASILTTAGDVFQLRNDLLASKHNQLFFSAEPLLEPPPLYLFSMSPEERKNIRWLIIGTLNKSGRPVPANKGGTKIEWIIDLVGQAQKYNIPIFMKKECYILYPELNKMFGELKALPYLEEYNDRK